jgi:hypothetical protein
MHTQTQETQAAIVGCNFQLFYREMKEMIDAQVPICVQIHSVIHGFSTGSTLPGK